MLYVTELIISVFTHQINDHILAPHSSPLGSHLAHMHHRLRIIRIDMEDWSIHHTGNISAVGRWSRATRISCEANLQNQLVYLLCFSFKVLLCCCQYYFLIYLCSKNNYHIFKSTLYKSIQWNPSIVAPWTRANPWIRAKWQLCKHVTFI